MPVRLSDRIGYYGAWFSGLFLTAVVFGIVAWLLVNGLRNIDWAFLTTNPAPGSVEIGVAGGIVFAEDGRVHIDRQEKLPLKEVEKDYPHYPDGARGKRLEGTCVVRYTIGKNGRVIDVAVIEHASDPMFDQETLDTVRKWRFRPLTINGQAVEVVHEIEVYYQFIQR